MNTHTQLLQYAPISDYELIYILNVITIFNASIVIRK